MLQQAAGKTLLLALLASLSAFSQTEHRARVNGKTLTEGQLELIMKKAPAEMKPLIARNPNELLLFYGLTDRMAELAEKEHLDADSVVLERLALARKQILADELANRYAAAHPATGGAIFALKPAAPRGPSR